MWKEHHDQYDLRYRLLSLLLHLADSPVNTVYEPPVHSDEEREAQVETFFYDFFHQIIFRWTGWLCSRKGRRSWSLGMRKTHCLIGLMMREIRRIVPASS